MANFDKYFPIEIDAEGAVYENVPGDNGGCTKYGLTLDDVKLYQNNNTLTCDSVKAIDRTLASTMLKKIYWDFFSADQINDQNLAMFLVDGGLNMGKILIAKYVQEALNIPINGQPDDKTIAAINAANSKDLYQKVYAKRKARYDDIVARHPSQSKFMKGWMNRLNLIKVV
jgi:lysozyme family protein